MSLKSVGSRAQGAGHQSMWLWSARGVNTFSHLVSSEHVHAFTLRVALSFVSLERVHRGSRFVHSIFINFKNEDDDVFDSRDSREKISRFPHSGFLRTHEETHVRGGAARSIIKDRSR